MVRWIFLSERLSALKTDLGCRRHIWGSAHLLRQPTGAAVCAAVSGLCFEILWVFWKFLLGLTEESQRRLRSISVLLHVRILWRRMGLACSWRKGALSYCSADSLLKQTRAFSAGVGQLFRSTAWLRIQLPIAAVSAGQRQGPRCERQTRALPWWGCATEHGPQQCWVSGPFDISSLSLSRAGAEECWGPLTRAEDMGFCAWESPCCQLAEM